LLMNWVLNAEQAGRNSFSLNRVHLGVVLNRDPVFFPRLEGKYSA
jgi:hypothetical protein